MATVSMRTITPKIWIPPESTPVYKVTIEDKNGNELDVTDTIDAGQVEDFINESIGSYEIAIPNSDGTYDDLLTEGKLFRYYKEYAQGEATVLKFTGIMEKISNRNNHVVITGRSIAAYFQDVTVTKQFASTEASDVLKSIINTYGGGRFTTIGVETSGVNVTVNWYQKKFTECVEELRKKTGFDIFYRADFDVQFYQSGSRDNDTDAITEDYNLIDVSDFAPDLALVKNRIIAYGSEIDGVQILYTSEDLNSQTLYGIKEEIINDDNITSYDQAKEIADATLSLSLDPPEVGDVMGTMIATYLPGENIRVSSPSNNLPPALYPSAGYKDDIINYSTTLYVSNEPRTISHIMREVITKGENKIKASNNPEEMRFAYTFTFDTDSGTHTNTEIINGVLRLQSGQASGNWVSEVRALSSNISEAYLILLGTLSSEATIEVSGNNGASYQTITPRTKLTMTTAKGSNLKVKVTLTTGIEIDSLNLLYKEE